MIRFRDSYADMEGTYYLQKRWNTIEIEEDTPTVRQILQKALETAEARDAWTLPEGDATESRTKREELLRDLTGRFQRRDPETAVDGCLTRAAGGIDPGQSFPRLGCRHAIDAFGLARLPSGPYTTASGALAVASGPDSPFRHACHPGRGWKGGGEDAVRSLPAASRAASSRIVFRPRKPYPFLPAA